MNADMRCDQVREIAPELALDIAAGEERDAALRHVAGCADCRRVVADFVSVGEELLVLAPPHDPPVGFESRVLAAIAERSGEVTKPERLWPVDRVPRPQPHRRRRSLAAVALAAALLLATALGGGSVFLATLDDRRLADSYRTVLGEGQGSFFAAAPLYGPEGRIGTVFGYAGDPSWIVVTLRSPIGGDGTISVVAVTTDGRSIDLGPADLADETVWGRSIPVSLVTVAEVRFVGQTGETTFRAAFEPADPWA